MSDINLIKNLKNKLTVLEDDAIFEQEIRSTGIFEELDFIFEGSPLLAQFGRDPLGARLAKYLHNKHLVSDRAKLEPYQHVKHPAVTNMELEDFKTHYDNFIIMHGPDGWAAAKPKEDYLKSKLGTMVPVIRNRKRVGTKPYDPSTDQDLPYVMYASLKGQNDIVIHEFTATRGGRYGHREKKYELGHPRAGEYMPNFADEMKKFVAKSMIDNGDYPGPKDVQVYRMLDREDPSMASIPPERFSGRRSRKLGAPGASVERSKIAAREKLRGVGADEISQQIADRLLKVAPKVLSKVAAIFYSEEGDLTPKFEAMQDGIENALANPGSADTDQSVKVWRDAVGTVLGSGGFIQGFQDKAKLLANQHNSNDELFSADINNFRIYFPNNKSSDSDFILKLSRQPPMWAVARQGANGVPTPMNDSERDKFIKAGVLDTKNTKLVFSKFSNAEKVVNQLNSSQNKSSNFVVCTLKLNKEVMLSTLFSLLKKELYSQLK